MDIDVEQQNETNIRVYSSIEFQCGAKFYREGLYSCVFGYIWNEKNYASISPRVGIGYNAFYRIWEYKYV